MDDYHEELYELRYGDEEYEDLNDNKNAQYDWDYWSYSRKGEDRSWKNFRKTQYKHLTQQ